ncbi:MAG: phosphate ABC transporter, permease protein PstA, partial [Roseimicrobium sp.]
GAWMPYALDEQCMALSMHLYTLSTQTPGVAPSVSNATAVLLLMLVFLVNSAAIALRMYLRSRE